ncbi:MAG: dihydroxyacetone kinase subunit L [Anaerolineales bacterium]|nr:dihydroxyacetone kinase subunit L [Anaerolineales bacterium]
MRTHDRRLTIISRDHVLEWLKALAATLAENKEYLTELDSAIGDADHGVKMDRGFQAALKKLPSVAGQDIGSIFKAVGMALVSTVGGASGPLYGTFFLQMGTVAADKPELTLDDWIVTFESGLDGVVRRGKANPGDKTMIDALLPGLEALKAAAANGKNLVEALQESGKAAEQGMKDTIPLVAKKGRASYLGERSAGHQDPGATSAYLILKTLVEVLPGGISQ